MNERLEEIKMKSNNTTEPMLYVPYSDFNWLIEQAERVQELEKKLNIATERGTKLTHKTSATNKLWSFTQTKRTTKGRTTTKYYSITYLRKLTSIMAKKPVKHWSVRDDEVRRNLFTNRDVVCRVND